MNRPKVGVVGVGRMGSNMAKRLQDVGYEVVAVYDEHAPIAQALAEELKSVAAVSCAEVTAAAEVILTVVTDDAAMDRIFTGEKSLLENASGKVFINCATLSPEAHTLAAERAAAVGAETLAASMASSITQAREGTLYLMIGGEKQVFERCERLLKDLSVSLRHVGTPAQSAQIKALVNMVMNINTAGLAEGLGLGEALGLDLEVLREVFSQTGANSRVLETDGEDMQIRDHECYFSAAHAAKDSGIANAMAQQQGLKVPLSQATEAQYTEMVARNLGDLDKSGVAELTFKQRGQSQ